MRPQNIGDERDIKVGRPYAVRIKGVSLSHTKYIQD